MLPEVVEDVFPLAQILLELPGRRRGGTNVRKTAIEPTGFPQSGYAVAFRRDATSNPRHRGAALPTSPTSKQKPPPNSSALLPAIFDKAFKGEFGEGHMSVTTTDEPL